MKSAGKDPMDPGQRAKQFMPFAALKGFEEELAEAEFRPVEQVEFSEDAAEELDRVLHEVEPGCMVQVVYYVRTPKGGLYRKKTGMVSRVDLVDRSFTVVKETIPFVALYDVVVLQRAEKNEASEETS